MFTTQEQYNVLRQPTRKLYIIVELLSEQGLVIDSLEGVTTEGSISISGDSTNRRSGTVAMAMKDNTLVPSPRSKIWLNTRCAISVGLDNYLGKKIWFSLGRFAISDVSISEDSSNNKIQLQLQDYMAFLDGTLDGTLSHKVEIKPNELTISEAIRYVCTGLGKIAIEDISIDGSSQKVPFLIEAPSGSSVYSLVKELTDLYQGYDFYYNKEGYLILERTRDRKQDPIIEVFDGEKHDFRITNNLSLDFKNAKNTIWVWGEQLKNGEQIIHTYTNRFERTNVSSMMSIPSKKIGDICYITEDDLSYHWNGISWETLSFNVVPSFNVETIGEKIYTVSDGNLFNNDQARLAAEKELTDRSNFLGSISFTCVPLYNLNVNDKIEIRTGNKAMDGVYLVQDLSIPLDISSTMSVTALKMYY